MHRLLLTLSMSAALFGPCDAGDEAEGAVKYLDHLKTCTPYTFRYPHPFIAGFMAQNIIEEKAAGNCLVTFVMPGNKKLHCRFTPDTIKLMTSEAKYEEARLDRYSGSTLDDVNQRIAEECKFE